MLFRSFNGDGYSEEWRKEAQKRKLPEFKDTVDVAPCLIKEENVKLFTKYEVFTPVELNSRYEITLRVYNKTKNIEAKTMIDMTEKQFLPAGLEYAEFLMKGAKEAKELGLDKLYALQMEKANKLSDVLTDINAKVEDLKVALKEAYAVTYGMTLKRATVYRDKVNEAMFRLRQAVDTMETLIPRKYYPIPSYVEL